MRSEHRLRWPILLAMITAQVMDLMAFTIVKVAGPSSSDAFHASPSQIQWAIAGDALTLGAGLVLGGRPGERRARRAMFLYGLTAFTTASLRCAWAPSIATLIALALVQGAAGAMLLPQVLGLLRENCSGPNLAKAFGIFAPVLGMAGIVAPLRGGGLSGADLFGLASIGVAVSASVLLVAEPATQPAVALGATLVVQLIMLCAFLAVTCLFPAQKHVHQEYTHA